MDNLPQINKEAIRLACELPVPPIGLDLRKSSPFQKLEEEIKVSQIKSNGRHRKFHCFFIDLRQVVHISRLFRGSCINFNLSTNKIYKSLVKIRQILVTKKNSSFLHFSYISWTTMIIL